MVEEFNFGVVKRYVVCVFAIRLNTNPSSMGDNRCRNLFRFLSNIPITYSLRKFGIIIVFTLCFLLSCCIFVLLSCINVDGRGFQFTSFIHRPGQ